MKMETKIALANMKCHKSKNVLTGIAIFLTTLLLFLVPTIGFDMIEIQFAVINEIYPNWHALYRDISGETVEKLAAHHMIERYGLRSDVGYMADEDAEIAILYMDDAGMELYNMELSEGKMPAAENEIVVSKGILEELLQEGKIGDTITVPCQLLKDGGLDYIQEKEFVISGFIADTVSSKENRIYSAFVSKSFLEREIPKEQITYRFLLQVNAEDSATTEEIESDINKLAEQFDIPEQSVRINTDYLGANYVDPAYVPAIIIIMLIVVAAGVITIYSIYYVSMGERVQEFGKIKAIGATKRQLRKIVLREGFAVAGVAIPAGLLTGTMLVKPMFLGMFELYQNENEIISGARMMIFDGQVQLYHLWIYLLTVVVAIITVYLSLLRPMKVAAKVSEIEAMRYRDGQSAKKKTRKGYQDITVGKLAFVYLAGNKKKSAITICSMAITGLFFMVVATVLSCANPTEAANNSMLGEYQVSPIIEFNNKDNPLTEELKQQILQIDGISSVECYLGTYVISDAFGGSREWVAGIPESSKEALENGIIEGNTTYEELTAGDKVIIDKKLLYWWPDLKIGDILDISVEDGNRTYSRKLEIVAVGDYPLSFSNYCYLIMAQEGLSTFTDNNLNFYYNIFAEKKYDPEVEARLQEIVEEFGGMRIRVWQNVYEEYKSNMAMTSGTCYAFLTILGVICIMNMVNTMIHSVHVRKREIGMLQAVGMSDGQLHKMLQLEGMFYTIGTLIISVGGGSLAGYPIFLWAKEQGIFNISNYHYPTEAAVIVAVTLLIVQVLLTACLGKSVKKESLIERIRFNN